MQGLVLAVPMLSRIRKPGPLVAVDTEDEQRNSSSSGGGSGGGDGAGAWVRDRCGGGLLEWRLGGWLVGCWVGWW